MTVSKRNKICITLVVTMIIFFLSAFLYLFYSYYPNLKNKQLLEKYGWEVLDGRRSGDSTFLNNEFLEREITIMQINASKKIGLNPIKYKGKEMVKYDYILRQTGLNDQLRAEVWRYKKDIICAYIFHAENNIKMKYWPLDTPYQEIRYVLETAK